MRVDQSKKMLFSQDNAKLKHIQGLRALCFCAVLVYHYKSSYLRWGYLGVDMFFYISGFLMTRSLLRTHSKGKFSYLEYFLKRFWRLLPTLGITCIFSTVVVLATSLPAELHDFLESAFCAMIGINNICLKRNSSDYFEISVQDKILLHTWSLSLEQQFYLVYPFIISAMFHFARQSKYRISAEVLVMVCLCSLSSFSLWLIYFGRYSAEAVFYLLPFRFFEFGMGGIVWIITSLFGADLWMMKADDNYKQKTILNRPSVQNVFSIFGFLIMTISIVGGIPRESNSMRVFCLFGLMLVTIAPNGFLSKYMLNHRFLQNLGEISYSAYLLHWPFLMFFSKFDECRGSVTNGFFLAISLYMLCYVSFVTIERRFLYQRGKRRPILLTTLFSFITFLYWMQGSSNFYALKGLVYDESLNNLEMSCPGLVEAGEQFPVPLKDREFAEQYVISNGTFTDYRSRSGADIVIVGSSFARHLLFGAQYVSERTSRKIVMFVRSNCSFDVSGSSHPLEEACRSTNNFFWDSIKKLNPEHVILAHAWNYNFQIHPGVEDYSELKRYIPQYFNHIATNISSIIRGSVYILGDVPTIGYSKYTHLLRCNRLISLSHGPSIFNAVQNYRVDPADVKVEEIIRSKFYTASNGSILRYIPVRQRFCDDERRKCNLKISVHPRNRYRVHGVKESFLFIPDGNHLSPWGSLAVGEEIIGHLN